MSLGDQLNEDDQIKTLQYIENKSLSTEERVELAKSIKDYIYKDKISDTWPLTLIKYLYKDSNQLIRRQIAIYLEFIPDPLYSEVANALLMDRAHYVVAIAEKACEKRKNSNKKKEQYKDQFRSIDSQRQAIKKEFGEKAATMAEKMALDLMSNLMGPSSHEIKRILSPIVQQSASLLSKLKDNSLEDKDLKRNLEVISSRSHVMLTLVRNMVAFSKKVPHLYDRILLSSIINEARNNTLNYFKEHKVNIGSIDIKIELDTDMLIDVAKEYIVLSLENCMRNAIESYQYKRNTFHKDKTVLVKTNKHKDKIIIQIIDTGIGIDPKGLELMKRYQPMASAKQYGTGFGIAISNKFIVEQGGLFNIQSKEDEGTTITIELPLRKS